MGAVDGQWETLRVREEKRVRVFVSFDGIYALAVDYFGTSFFLLASCLYYLALRCW